jgi:hypothetical protein
VARLRAGRLGFDSRQGLDFTFFATSSNPALESTQPTIQGLPGALSLRIKRPGSEADHSPPYSAQVKNGWSYASIPPIRLHSVVHNQAIDVFMEWYLITGINLRYLWQNQILS